MIIFLKVPKEQQRLSLNEKPPIGGWRFWFAAKQHVAKSKRTPVLNWIIGRNMRFVKTIFQPMADNPCT
jgi:hypothetical protein